MLAMGRNTVWEENARADACHQRCLILAPGLVGPVSGRRAAPARVAAAWNARTRKTAALEAAVEGVQEAVCSAGGRELLAE